jgi:hypothetical protein
MTDRDPLEQLIGIVGMRSVRKLATTRTYVGLPPQRILSFMDKMGTSFTSIVFNRRHSLIETKPTKRYRVIHARWGKRLA